MKNRKTSPLITGTIILTLTGFITRIIGFFYRIFLSHNFGEEGMGIFQLISPVMALSFSLTASGIQTAISKYVAMEPSTRDYKSSFRILLVGTAISCGLSAVVTCFLYRYADWIAVNALFEARCAPLIRIIAISIPFGAVHSCVNGYFYGIKQTKIPAITQFTEQIVRVGFVYVTSALCIQRNYTPTIGFAVVGVVFGEAVSMVISLAAIYHRFYALKTPLKLPDLRISFHTGNLLMGMAIPLMANRIVINLLQSVEAIYIPNRLQLAGLSNSAALSIYGVLTGMAMPLIFFPSAITNSVSVLLLPMVSEAESNDNHNSIHRAVIKSIRYCLLLGFLSTTLFLLIGRSAGKLLFNSEMAGTFIITLSFICPFLYLTSTLSSILNGLGKTTLTFLFSIISLGVRLLFVFYAIPIYGIKGYLWGILVSQLLITVLIMSALRNYIFYQKKKVSSP